MDSPADPEAPERALTAPAPSVPMDVEAHSIVVAGREIVVYLEPALWRAFLDICQDEGLTAGEACAAMERRRHLDDASAALRSFTIRYLRTALAAASRRGFSERSPFGPSQEYRKALDALAADTDGGRSPT